MPTKPAGHVSTAASIPVTQSLDWEAQSRVRVNENLSGILGELGKIGKAETADRMRTFFLEFPSWWNRGTFTFIDQLGPKDAAALFEESYDRDKDRVDKWKHTVIYFLKHLYIPYDIQTEKEARKARKLIEMAVTITRNLMHITVNEQQNGQCSDEAYVWGIRSLMFWYARGASIINKLNVAKAIEITGIGRTYVESLTPEELAKRAEQVRKSMIKIMDEIPEEEGVRHVLPEREEAIAMLSESSSATLKRTVVALEYGSAKVEQERKARRAERLSKLRRAG